MVDDPLLVGLRRRTRRFGPLPRHTLHCPEPASQPRCHGLWEQLEPSSSWPAAPAGRLGSDPIGIRRGVVQRRLQVGTAVRSIRETVTARAVRRMVRGNVQASSPGRTRDGHAGRRLARIGDPERATAVVAWDALVRAVDAVDEECAAIRGEAALQVNV